MDHLSRLDIDKDEEVYLIRIVLFFFSFSATVICAPSWAVRAAAT
jgi:hypothetical protein